METSSTLSKIEKKALEKKPVKFWWNILGLRPNRGGMTAEIISK